MNVKNIGSFLILAGIASIVLNLIGYDLRILMWINNWGETTGWVIRAGLVVVGAAIFFMVGNSQDEAEEETA